jgi:peroxiredoxin Q/BCP
MKLKYLAGLLGLGLVTGVALRAEPIDVGAHAPQVAAIDENGQTVQLGDLYKKGYVLVYFYPKAGTKGCTAQACSLRDAYEKLTDRGVTVVGVSTDNVTDQKKFHEEQSLPFVLIADSDHKVVDAFGVPLMRGTMATRQAFLMKDGVVVWRDLTASTAEQANDVLAALDALKNKPAAS